jgi:FAD synthase
VLLLADQGVCGIIAGSNYRFGYKAAGDAALLQELGSKHGLVVEIVDIVMSSDMMHGQMKRVRRGGDSMEIPRLSLSSPPAMATERCPLVHAALPT